MRTGYPRSVQYFRFSDFRANPLAQGIAVTIAHSERGIRYSTLAAPIGREFALLTSTRLHLVSIVSPLP